MKKKSRLKYAIQSQIKPKKINGQNLIQIMR